DELALLEHDELADAALAHDVQDVVEALVLVHRERRARHDVLGLHAPARPLPGLTTFGRLSPKPKRPAAAWMLGHARMSSVYERELKGILAGEEALILKSIKTCSPDEQASY